MKKFCFVLSLMLLSVCLMLNTFAAEQEELEEFYSAKSWNYYSGAAKYSPDASSVSFYTYLGELNAICTLKNEMDLRYYKNLIFDLKINSDSVITEPLAVELTLYSDTSDSSYSQIVFPSSSARITFSLSDFEEISAITNIGLRVTSADGESGYLSFTLSNARLTGKIDKERSMRYMCERFEGYGLSLNDYGEYIDVAFFDANAEMIGDVTVAAPDEMPDAIRIVYTSEKTLKNTRVTLWQGSDELSADFTLEATDSPAVKLVPLGEKIFPDTIALSFDDVTSGGLRIYSVCAVSTYNGSTTELGTSLSCSFKEDNGYIVVSGNLPSEVASRRSTYSLALFELDAYDGIDAVYSRNMSPIATYPMSTRFEFRIPLQSNNYLPLLSKYAVVIYNSGEPTDDVVMLPRYIATTARSQNTEKSQNAFKGMINDDGVTAELLGCGSIVIDVYLNDLISLKNIGQLHSIYGGYYYFSFSAVSELDKRIGSATAGGADVILRLLVKNERQTLPYAYADTSSGAELLSMRADDWESMMYVHALTDFLVSRYNGGTNGKISGIVVGSGINEPSRYNSMGESYSLCDYIERYTSVLRVMQGSIENRGANVRLYVPLSSNWTNTVIDEHAESYDTPLLMYVLCQNISREGTIPLSLLLEGEIESGYLSDLPERICAENISLLKNEMKSPLGAEAGFDSLTFVWKPYYENDEDLKWNYCNAYGILYNGGVDAFVIDLTGYDIGDYTKTVNSIKYIDTKRLLAYLPDDLGTFTYKNDEVVSGDKKLKYRILRDIFTFSFDDEIKFDVKGKYDYFDFTSSYDTLGWCAGSGCTALESSQGADERILSAHSDGSFSVYYSFDRPENMTWLSTLSLDVEILGAGDARLVLQMFSDDGQCDVVKIIECAQRSTVYFDMSEYAGSKSVKYLKISVSGDEVEGLEIHRISGFSELFDDVELAEKIESERNKTQTPTIDRGTVVTAIAVAVLVLSLLGVFCVTRIKKKSENA